jgi:hypothetical protein
MVLGRAKLKAEESHHSLTEILRDMAAELGNCVACGSMIRGQYFMPLLRIQMSGDFSRVHQVGEEDHEMSPLTASILLPTAGTCRTRGGFRF